jgi:formate hydrogenlyase subunit 4
MILFVLTVASLALILGGLSVQSPYSRIGGYREILEVLAYEPVLVLMVAGIYLATGSFGVGSVFRQTGPLLFRLPLLFLAFLTILPIKLRKSPFDLSSSHHAHQEIVRGVTTEYSGPYLALIEIGHWYELTFVLGLAGLFWVQSPAVAIVVAAVAFLLPILIDNISARLTWRTMLRFTWTVGLGLSLINLAMLYLKWPGVK